MRADIDYDGPTGGLNPSYASPRPEIAALVPPGARSVLDVGCSSGELGRLLKTRDPSTRVVGIDGDAAAAQQAGGVLDRAIVGDLDALDVSTALKGERFDAIVLADVLEHLAAPWALLRTLRDDHLQCGGLIVVSLPNVRHVSLLWALVVRGVWPVRRRGLCDRTHRHFFTLSNIEALLAAAGLEMTTLERHLRVMDRTGSWINGGLRSIGAFRLLARLAFVRELLTYQYVLTARPC